MVYHLEPANKKSPIILDFRNLKIVIANILERFKTVESYLRLIPRRTREKSCSNCALTHQENVTVYINTDVYIVGNTKFMKQMMNQITYHFPVI